jgi:hypothetical protein
MGENLPHSKSPTIPVTLKPIRILSLLIDVSHTIISCAESRLKPPHRRPLVAHQNSITFNRWFAQDNILCGMPIKKPPHPRHIEAYQKSITFNRCFGGDNVVLEKPIKSHPIPVTLKPVRSLLEAHVSPSLLIDGLGGTNCPPEKPIKSRPIPVT